MLQAYQEISQIMAEEGKPAPLLDFVYHYDMKSFFKYFDFLNVSRVAQRAGINPSLMRKYAAGVVKAGEAQYQKLQKAISEMAAEMSAACF